MAVILAGIVLLSWMLLFVIRLVSTRIIEDNMFHYLEITQKEAGKRLELIYDEVNMVAVRLMTNYDLSSIINSDTLSYDEKLIKFRAYAKNETDNLDALANIIIINNSQETFMLLDRKLQMIWANSGYENRLRQSTKLIEWGGAVRDENGNAYLVMGKRFRNLYTGNPLGSLYLLIPETVLSDVCRQIVPDMGYTFLIDQDNRVLSHPDKAKVGSIIYDADAFSLDTGFQTKEIVMNNQNDILAMSSLDDNLSRFEAHYRAVSLVDKGKLFAILQQINRYVLYIMILISFMGIVLSFRLSFNITKPILRLKEKISHFGKDDTLSDDMARQSKDEIWQLEQSFHDMIDRIRELISKINNEKEIQRELEFVALQAQINPHFLYNTLDTIGWIAKIKKQAEIEKLVLSLAKFFRISLHKGDKFITVQEELELVKSYVSIEQIRFPNRFDLTLDVDEDILGLKIPKIILQPLVENAIKHGISNMAEPGHIHIEGILNGSDILLTVSDNGAGFEQTSALPRQSMSGYGLKNVHKRIELEYGGGYGVNITSSPGAGTRVTLKLNINPSVQEQSGTTDDLEGRMSKCLNSLT